MVMGSPRWKVILFLIRKEPRKGGFVLGDAFVRLFNCGLTFVSSGIMKFCDDRENAEVA